MVMILTATGRHREICGVITEVWSEGSDGGLALYRLIIEPITAALKLSTLNRVILGLSRRDAALLLLNEEIQQNSVFGACLSIDNRCRRTCETREMISIINEDKWSAIRRLLSLDGISYAFAASSKNSTSLPQHALILFDDPQALDVCETGAVPFQGIRITGDADSITKWCARQILQASGTTRQAWNHAFGGLSTPVESLQSDQGTYGKALAATLEDYRFEPSQEHSFSTKHSALLPVLAKEQRTQLFVGEGSVREFRAGVRFPLVGHPVHDRDRPVDREFVLLRVELEAENNLPLGLRVHLGLAKEPGQKLVYRNRFECVRASGPIVPSEVERPPISLITGTVVGPEGAVVHTDDCAKIKVRLHPARRKDHKEAGASGTDRDSVWIRVVQFGASHGAGSNFIPRVGDEVLLGAMGGDPDYLVVLGILPGNTRKPGHFSQISELPADKAISGFRSQEHGGTRGSQLLFDDTLGQIRTQLASDHGATQLNLGWITTPRQRGQAAQRGQGFELRTDEFGALRAGRGLLVSSDAQEEAGGDQLGIRGMAGQLGSALTLADSLSEACGQAEVEALGANPALKQAQGHLAGTIRSSSGGSTREISVFQQPVLALSSPSDILSATPANQIISAGENLHATVGEDANWAVGGKFIVAVKELISFFAAKAGILMTAAKGAIRIEAQNGPISILGDQDVKVASNSKSVHVDAKEEIILTAGGCLFHLKGGVCKIVAPIAVEMHTAAIKKLGSSDAASELMKAPAPKGLYDEQFVLRDKHTNEPLAHAPYRVKLPDGQEIAGHTDAEGRTQRIHTGTGAKGLQFFLD